MGTDKLKIFSIVDWLANAWLHMEFTMHIKPGICQPINNRENFQFICPYLSLVNWAVISLHLYYYLYNNLITVITVKCRLITVPLLEILRTVIGLSVMIHL